MNLDELEELASEVRAAGESCTHCVRVCMAAGCQSSGARPVLDGLNEQLGGREDVQVKSVGCMGLCSGGPLVEVQTRGQATPVLYQNVAEADAAEVAASLGGEPVQRLVCPTDVPFFASQQKVVLENSGVIDPEDIIEYIAAEGYRALVTALTEMNRAEVLRESRSAACGDAGAAAIRPASSGRRWPRCRPTRSTSSAMADEGDPGAFMDRAVLESDPHRVLEGMAIAAYAVGASAGYIYVRAEYPLAIDRLTTAIRQATKRA
jgi:bidirectional [NiFe] hydrogenase diaphorase subunit